MLKTVITTVTFFMEHAEKLFKQTAIGPSHNSQKENNMQIASCMITKIIIIHHGLLIYDNSLLLCLFDKLSSPLYDTDIKLSEFSTIALKALIHIVLLCARSYEAAERGEIFRFLGIVRR